MSVLQKLCRFGVQSLAKRFYNTNSLANAAPKFQPAFFAVVKNPWIWQKPSAVESPLRRIAPVELPRTTLWVPVEAPALPEHTIEKQAVRLIVIRRHKMRKHKLKKLRRKMKFEWAKRRQKREMKKEKLFHAELLAQIKEAEAFDAQRYVADKIRMATETPIPRFWKGKRLPEFVIREKLGLPPK